MLDDQIQLHMDISGLVLPSRPKAPVGQGIRVLDSEDHDGGQGSTHTTTNDSEKPVEFQEMAWMLVDFVNTGDFRYRLRPAITT